jgi:ubiquinone/menaquinone biosynthesis C-methylase UbiE
MNEATVRQQYNQVAAIYDRRWHSYLNNTLQFLKTWLNYSANDTILDIACGTGELERIIVGEHPRQKIVGVDISEEMLAVARHKMQSFPSVSFQIASASVLPFADQSFDLIVSANAFHYFDNPIVALTEMKRVLKPDGKIVILDWCRDFILCKICDFLLRFLDPAHQRCYTQKEFHHFLTSTGFEIERAKRVRFDWIWGLMVTTATRK